jgi:3-methyl-2-oxobutanoate hydroxymethyltransferase
MTNVRDFAAFKAERRKISIVTAYDAWSAHLVERSNVDAILIGDSAAMVMHGHTTTVPATVSLMALHTAAVARATTDTFLIADMPFLSYRQGVRPAMRAVGTLLKNGAHAVKLEGVDGNERVIRQIVESGVPLMGHIGMTPQSVHQFGGFRVQGRRSEDADRILREAHELERLGCFSIVLECIPAELGGRITSELTIPTIGIGAGPCTDGQVLVLQDLWGVGSEHAPRFVRRYLDGDAVLTDALNRYNDDVKGGRFPDSTESYS